MRRLSTSLICAAASVLFQIATAPVASAAILGTAGSFAVLAGSTVTNTGPTVIGTAANPGNVGVSPGSAVTGFPPGTVTAPGTIHAADAVALQAQADNTIAYNALKGLAPSGVLTGQDLGTLTPLTSGVYFFASSAQLTGTLTLDAQNNANAFWVFQIGSTLTTASSSSVVFTNTVAGFNPGLYWQVGSSATLGTTTSFQGNILALASISLTTGATIGCGSALAQTGAVTLDTNTISTGCDGGLKLASGGTDQPPVVVGPGGTPLPVPEPGSLLLMGTAFAALVVARRPRKA